MIIRICWLLEIKSSLEGALELNVMAALGNGPEIRGNTEIHTKQINWDRLDEDTRSILDSLLFVCSFDFFPFASSVYTISLFSNILFAVYRSLPSATDYYLEYLLCCVGALSISLVICLNRETENVYLMIISCKIIF